MDLQPLSGLDREWLAAYRVHLRYCRHCLPGEDRGCPGASAHDLGLASVNRVPGTLSEEELRGLVAQWQFWWLHHGLDRVDPPELASTRRGAPVDVLRAWFHWWNANNVVLDSMPERLYDETSAALVLAGLWEGRRVRGPQDL